MSTVGMEISASTTTTDVDASAPERDTMAATSSSPIAAATMTVSTAIMRFVREPAISQLNTSAPVPSVPNGCAADGEAHALNPLVSSSEYGVHTKDRADTSSHAPMTISVFAAGLGPDGRKHGFHGGSGCHVGDGSHGSRRSLRGRR